MKYSLGLDIGTTSIGWAVVNEDKERIEDLGVRIFERPENPKNGESLAKPRRDARSTRRRLKRRRDRLDYLKRFFVEHQLLSEEQISSIFSYDGSHTHKNPYFLRAKSIKEKVANDELFVALYHIAKRRGYKSNRRTVEEKDKESGKVLNAIKTNRPLLVQYSSSIAVTLLQDDKFAEHKRNKDGKYENSFIRADFETEILAILHTQGWSNDWINELLYSNPSRMETKGGSGLFYQRPFMNEILIRKMRGKCQYEDAPRAPKASYSFDIFRAAQDLAHLEYNQGEKLTPSQIQDCIEAFKEIKEPSYTTIRKILGYAGDESFQFDHIRGKEENGEKINLGGLKFYHMVKAALKDLPEDWLRVEGDTELFDQIGEILTLNKDDESLERALTRLDIGDEARSRLMPINVSGFCHLSTTALRKLTPRMLDGNTYDKAVELAYPGEFSEKLFGDGNELPSLSEEQLHQLTNPVVKRAISQARKVINAVIRKYGAPYQIKIECATDLAKNFKDRKEIEKQQKENAAYNEVIKSKLEELGITNPTGQQIIKYKLREQQNCKCMYCGAPISTDIFMDEKLAEIDHIVPFSVCGNDGIQNKVLVCTKCNQEKKNHIPFDAWGKDTARWETIVTLANDPKIPAPKRDRILCEKPPKEGWNERALNDTRYVSKFMTRYIKQNLRFAESEKGRQKVLAPTGFITSYLRKIYGIGSKDRELNNCHHAVDACIIATVSQGQIQKISEWNKYKELGAKYHTVLSYDEDGGAQQVTTKEYEQLRNILPPWKDFAKEVRIRSGMSHNTGEIEKLTELRDKFRQFKTYDEEFLQKIHPLFVSRMPKRSMNGRAHEETIRSPKAKGDMRTCRKKLDKEFAKNYTKNPSKSWLENSVLVESDRILYEQFKKLLAEKGENAFDEPVYKNNKKIDKNGHLLSPVRTVKVYEKKPNTSGVYLNNGTQFADNGKTVCLNIYQRKDCVGKNRLFAAPLYAHSLNKKEISVLPTPTGRSAEEKSEFNKLRNADGLIMATSQNGFEFVARVFPNDYIRITYPDCAVEGYYVKYNSSGGNICLLPHNRSSKKDTDFINCSLGKAIKAEVIPISILGDNYKFE